MDGFERLLGSGRRPLVVGFSVMCVFGLASCDGSDGAFGGRPTGSADGLVAYDSHEDVLAALEEGGYNCDAVDVSVRDRDGQELGDSGLPSDLTDAEREFVEQSLLEDEESLRSQGIVGWSTCWWRDDRLDIMLFDSEQTRIRSLVSGLGFGCGALPGGRAEIPYVHGDEWTVVPGFAETSMAEMTGIAESLGGRAVEASCADIFSAMDSWESSSTDFEAVSVEELRSVLGEQQAG